ncbi:hypothetical protein V6N12_027612 [Hibiscus sabdariffa]|uniref:Serine-threonine/tyrosine-protein kinase catalytic domain-containing protein n=1 Tax=Hibiscus sabdariffa TaxID=183260 RepID=A0ABR2F3H4_9ROSI
MGVLLTIRTMGKSVSTSMSLISGEQGCTPMKNLKWPLVDSKGVLEDGTIVAVKQAIISSDKPKNSKEFHTELDLLSRLNHAHLLNLLSDIAKKAGNGFSSMSLCLMDLCTNIFMERTKP